MTPANRASRQSGAENRGEIPSAGAGPTIEDVALLQRPSVRDAVADDLVDGRAAGLGEVVVVERRWVAVPRRAGLATASTSQGRYNLDWRRRCLPAFFFLYIYTSVCFYQMHSVVNFIRGDTRFDHHSRDIQDFSCKLRH